MRLCSIINAWEDTVELLPMVILNHLEFCDGVVLVVSQQSNRFNFPSEEWIETIEAYARHEKVFVEFCEPEAAMHAQLNETRKRNRGILRARELRFTHFFLSDADEFYNADEVDTAKQLFIDDRLNGIVAKSRVYIKSPTLWVADHTLVPFIHKMRPETYCGSFRKYPFAYDQQGHAHIDPTRRINVTRGVIMCDVIMHHMSYVRRNIDLKIANSSANLKRSEHFIKADIANAKPGYRVTFNYNDTLKECKNEFNIHV